MIKTKTVVISYVVIMSIILILDLGFKILPKEWRIYLAVISNLFFVLLMIYTFIQKRKNNK